MTHQHSRAGVHSPDDSSADSSSLVNHPAITFAPGAEIIAHAIRQRQSLTPQAAQFRAELGLDSTCPIIMSGHQAEFWHPGILAKFLALQHAAARWGAQAAWLVVDQDTGQPWDIRYPVEHAGTLDTRIWSLAPAPPRADIPLMRTSALRPAQIPGDVPALSSMAARLRSIHSALGVHAHSSSVARQFGAAAIELASVLTPDLPPPRLIFASEIAGTTFFGELLNGLATSDHDAAIIACRAYNAARAQSPSARVAPLGDSELPLWRIGPEMNSPRRPATFDDAASAPHELFPRALMLTGLVRALACDLFIHGTGGAGASGADGYDRITQAWFADWLKLPLAPALMVTATQHVRFPSVQLNASPASILHAQWLAHSAAHQPHLLDDPKAAAERARLLGAIHALKRDRTPQARPQRKQAYQALHDWLATWRADQSSRLAALVQSAQSAAAQRTTVAIANDRTWAFPLYDRAQLERLSAEIATRVAGVVGITR